MHLSTQLHCPSTLTLASTRTARFTDHSGKSTATILPQYFTEERVLHCRPRTLVDVKLVHSPSMRLVVAFGTQQRHSSTPPYRLLYQMSPFTRQRPACQFRIRDRSNLIKGRIVEQELTHDLLIADPTLNSTNRFCVFRQRVARIMRRSLNTREHAIRKLFNGEEIPQIALYHGGSGPHLAHGYCGPPHPTCQTASRSVQPFYFCRIPCCYMTDHATRQ